MFRVDYGGLWVKAQYGGEKRGIMIPRDVISFALINLEAACAFHFANYNFCRIHQTLKCTPAMEGGITSRLWNLEDLLEYEMSYKSN